jgi:hypothetical protein
VSRNRKAQPGRHLQGSISHGVENSHLPCAWGSPTTRPLQAAVPWIIGS